MNLAEITSSDAKRILQLLEQRESLENLIADINRELATYGTGTEAKVAATRTAPRKKKAAAKKKRRMSPEGRANISAAATARWAKRRAESPSADQTAKPAAAKKTARTKRAKAKAKAGRGGELKESIIGLLQGAGKSGLTVKEISSQLGLNPQRIYAWFNMTGKRVDEIKKLKPATYGWVG